MSANVYNGGIIGAAAVNVSGVWGVGDRGITYGESVIRLQYVIIAGGGGGGAGDASSIGGGGGGGGYRTNVTGQTSGENSSAEVDFLATIGQLLTVTVGAGGAGGGSSTNGTVGSDSVFASFTSKGGGGGGRTNNLGTGVASSGGSGGGRGWNNAANSAGAGTANQGFAGSNYNSGGVGGGGGGAGSLPTTAAGGNGLTSDITGSTSSSRAAGGGSLVDGTPAANTGNGGNSQNSPRTGTAGGSGIVVIRYPDTFANLLINAGLTFRTSVGGSGTGSGARETPSYTITNWKVYEFTAGTGSVQV